MSSPSGPSAGASTSTTCGVLQVGGWTLISVTRTRAPLGCGLALSQNPAHSRCTQTSAPSPRVLHCHDGSPALAHWAQILSVCPESPPQMSTCLPEGSSPDATI